MPDLDLVFTGVNAYVYPASNVEPPKPLMIVMPNATKLGKSKQDPSLPAHFPTVWAYDANRQLVYLQYFLWERLEISSDQALSATAPVQDPAHLLKIPQADVAKMLKKGVRVCAQVEVTTGEVDNIVGPCTGDTVTGQKRIQWPPGSNLDDNALLHQVGLSISSADPIVLTLHNLFDGTTRGLPAFPHDASEIFVGNVCAQDILGWPTNDGQDEADTDFAWLDVLAGLGGMFPMPVIAAGKCDVGDDEAVDAKLQTKVKGLLGASFGGGGCGCQCIGCQVALTP